jgi:hypothetical protein
MPRRQTTPYPPGQLGLRGAARPRAARVVIGHPARYAPPMESTQAGELVSVTGGGPVIDGIVFDTPSNSKVVVAVMDPARGPVFRTVHPRLLDEREQEGPHDRALRLLMRRTPSPVHGAVRGGGRGGRERPGHARAASHRTTGK